MVVWIQIFSYIKDLHLLNSMFLFRNDIRYFDDWSIHGSNTENLMILFIEHADQFWNRN